MEKSTSSGLNVAERLSPPDSTKITSRSGWVASSSSIAAWFIEVSSRMAVCGQPPVSMPTMRSRGQHAVPGEDLGVLDGVDVVGDRRHRDLVAQGPGQAFD